MFGAKYPIGSMECYFVAMGLARWDSFTKIMLLAGIENMFDMKLCNIMLCLFSIFLYVGIIIQFVLY